MLNFGSSLCLAGRIFHRQSIHLETLVAFAVISLTTGHSIGNVEEIPLQRCRVQRNCHAHARVLLAEVVQIQNDTKVLVLVINKIK